MNFVHVFKDLKTIKNDSKIGFIKIVNSARYYNTYSKLWYKLWINNPTKTNIHTFENSCFNFEFFREYFEKLYEIVCIFWQAGVSMTFFN